jgi:hypothetical protein
MNKLFVLALASLTFFGCAAPSADAPSDSTPEALTRAPSKECGAVARSAVEALEALNGDQTTISRVELVEGFSDNELIRVSVSRAGKDDSYLVDTESMGGSPCFVYGLQIKTQAIDLSDDGAPSSDRPSTVCGETALNAVKALTKVNGDSITIGESELVAAHSDHELVRVNFTDGQGRPDSYLVNTESMGGDPCLVYGLQLRSEEMDLTDE